jgi:integrase
MDGQREPHDGRQEEAAIVLMPSQALVPAPVGGDGTAVSAWFDAAVEAEQPLLDGTLEAERDAADAYARMAKAENTRRAYRAAVRAWCAWCLKRDLPPLPATGADIAAFLAGERGRNLSPETLKLRRAAIRYLHRAAGCPVPTDDVCVSETLAGIQRDAARKGQLPRKKVAATATILRRLLVPIPGDLRGLRDRALLLVGFAGALRRSELAAIRLDHLEKTDRGIRLTLPHSKGAQDSAVTVPLPYGDTELCPVHALEAWLQAAGLTAGPVFRRIWLPPLPKPGGPPPLPRIGTTAITAQTVAQVVQARAVAAGFGLRELGGHSLKRGALTTGMDRGIHPAKLKRLGRHKSFDVLGEYLEFGDLFEGHPLSGVL